MGCAITQGYLISCTKDSLGGLREVWAANYDDVLEITEGFDGTIGNITMKEGKQFFRIQLHKNTSSFQSIPTVNSQNGIKYYAESISLVFNRLRATTSKLIDELASGSFMFLVQDRNGEVILLGRNMGLEMSTGSAGSGTNPGDRNGYEATLGGEGLTISHVDPTAFSLVTSGGTFIPPVNEGVFSSEFASTFA